ncbi:ribosome maturation factor RimM [Betaproteobacteria bacterium]|nr:ribosome maturation factor RimM [Betaproteobacteria bacterium]
MPADTPADIIVLGKIVDSYGLRGGVKVHPFADDPESWGAMPRWWLGREGDAPQGWRCLRVIHCREHSGLLIATLEGVVDRDASELLRGMLVGAPREELPATESGEYYWGDLVGLEVVNVRGQSLGRVLELIAAAGNDVLRVAEMAGKESKERLLPFVDAVVREVNVAERRILVDWEADW